MIAIMKTNNPVSLSYAQSVLKDRKIESFIMDTHQSIFTGALGLVYQRLMVIEEDYIQAYDLLADAGLEEELCRS